MTCETLKFTLKDGSTARGFACVRGKKWPRCSACKLGNTGTKLCDAPVLVDGRWTTCDAPICGACAVACGDDVDLCPACARDPALLELMVAGELKRSDA